MKRQMMNLMQLYIFPQDIISRTVIMTFVYNLILYFQNMMKIEDYMFKMCVLLVPK